jgi:glucose-1-phosphate adenylyltransferase
VIQHAIIEKGCIIPDGTKIGVDPKQDAENYYVTPKGVVLVTPEMLGQEIHHVR